MNSEHQLNAKITAALKKSGEYMYLKTCEKYVAGISDFLVWKDGLGLAMEVKLTTKKLKGKGKLLGHPFSTAQLSFLEGFSRIGGGKSWGIIGVKELKRMYPIHWSDIPESGNWSIDDFLAKHGETFIVDWGVEDLMKYIFREG